VVVVLNDSPTEGVMSCARVVVGAVGMFRGESPFEGFAHRFDQECPSDGVHCCNGVPIKCGDAWRHPVARSEEAELLVSEASWGGGVRAGGVRCAVRSLRLARVRASGVITSLRDEAVAGVVIVCPSTQQTCSYSTSTRCCGLATRRRWLRFPGQCRPLRRSAAM